MEFTSSRVRLISSLPLCLLQKLTLSLYILQTGEKRTLFDAETAGIVPKVVHPESEQEPNESRRSVPLSSSYPPQPDRRGVTRLWSKLTEAIKNKDMEAATIAKTTVEDAQRESTRRREQFDVKYEPRFFKMEKDGRWLPKIQ